MNSTNQTSNTNEKIKAKKINFLSFFYSILVLALLFFLIIRPISNRYDFLAFRNYQVSNKWNNLHITYEGRYRILGNQIIRTMQILPKEGYELQDSIKNYDEKYEYKIDHYNESQLNEFLDTQNKISIAVKNYVHAGQNHKQVKDDENFNYFVELINQHNDEIYKYRSAYFADVKLFDQELNHDFISRTLNNIFKINSLDIGSLALINSQKYIKKSDISSDDFTRKIVGLNYMTKLNYTIDKFVDDTYYFSEDNYGVSFSYPRNIMNYEFMERYYNNSQDSYDSEEVYKVDLIYEDKNENELGFRLTLRKLFDEKVGIEKEVKNAYCQPRLCSKFDNENKLISYEMHNNNFYITYVYYNKENIVDLSLFLDDKKSNYAGVLNQVKGNENHITNKRLLSYFSPTDKRLVEIVDNIFSSIKIDPTIVTDKISKIDYDRALFDIRMGKHQDYRFYEFSGSFRGVNRKADEWIDNGTQQFVDTVNNIKIPYKIKYDGYYIEKRVFKGMGDSMPWPSYELVFYYHDVKEDGGYLNQDLTDFTLSIFNYRNAPNDVFREEIMSYKDRYLICEERVNNSDFTYCYDYNKHDNIFEFAIFKFENGFLVKMETELRDYLDLDLESLSTEQITETAKKYISEYLVNDKVKDSNDKKFHVVKDIISHVRIGK